LFIGRLCHLLNFHTCLQLFDRFSDEFGISGGPAQKGGVLRKGDEILKVNDHAVWKLNHFEAWDLLKSQAPGVIKLLIHRPLEIGSSEDVVNLSI
jgi:C-terminal processing protease CtpA/Prc